MALRVGAVCLRVLSTPAATRETITHASNALISVVVASWRSDGLWPGGTPTAGFNTTNRGAGTSLAECRRTPPTTDDCEEAVDSFDAACTILRKAFFPAWQEQCSPQRRRRQKDRIAVSKGDDASVLIASFMPLPPRATLAVCRAIIHAVSPGVLLARVLSNAEEIHEETNEDGGKCLLTGPVLREILQWCGANSALQLRFLGLQVSI